MNLRKDHYQKIIFFYFEKDLFHCAGFDCIVILGLKHGVENAGPKNIIPTL